MKQELKEALSDQFLKMVKNAVLPEVKQLEANVMIAEIGKYTALKKGYKKGISGAGVLVSVVNPEEDRGDLLEGVFGRGNPPGIPVGDFVAELVNDFGDGSMNIEMEEWRLDCVKEIREKLDKLEAVIRERMKIAEA